MRRSWTFVALPACAPALILVLSACGTDGPRIPVAIQADAAGPYVYKAGSPDGIGKFYMGREIAQVMGHPGAEWLERDSRVAEERTDLLVDNLPLQPDHVVVDLGAGTGYFTLLIAARVPQGRVLAVDIQPEMLDIIARRVAAGGLKNVQTVLGKLCTGGYAGGSCSEHGDQIHPNSGKVRRERRFCAGSRRFPAFTALTRDTSPPVASTVA
jgi:hypothetical protein